MPHNVQRHGNCRRTSTRRNYAIIACKQYCFHAILVSVRVEWTDEFDLWLSRIEEQAEAGDEQANRQLDYIAAELQLLRELDIARDATTRRPS